MKQLIKWEKDLMRIGKSRGSHLPVLSTIISKTYGSVLELGVGFCSTPYLHWACFPTKRRLVSYEHNRDFYKFADSWKDDFHHVITHRNWDEIDLSEPWSVAFVDHCPNDRRWKEINRLLHADYVVIHDSENANARKYGLNKVYRKFKYRYKYTAAWPYTSIWSNRYDVRQFTVI